MAREPQHTAAERSIGVDRGARVVFARALAEQETVTVDDQVVIGRCNIDVRLPQEVAVFGKGGG